MNTVYLHDNWTVTIEGKNVYNIPEEPISTTVPSTVYGTLLEHKLMPDPYFRDNELNATKLMENNFVYETKFTLSEDQRNADRVFLRFDGIDTIADIYLNDLRIGFADNMNRTWEYDITLHVADDSPDTVYTLKVFLHSPLKYIEKAQAENPVGGSDDAMPGFPHIRKAACMFGWDWGPRLPDAGIFRDVMIESVKTARLGDVYIGEEHFITGKNAHGNIVSKVKLHARINTEWMPEATDENLKLMMTVTSPSGNKINVESDRVNAHGSTPAKLFTGNTCEIRENSVRLDVDIEDPELWWPNGYGRQPLYDVNIILLSAGNDDDDKSDSRKLRPLDTWHKRIGLRTVTVNTDEIKDEVWDPHMKNQTPDVEDGTNLIFPQGSQTVAITDKTGKKLTGRNFAFEVNGLQIFAMGADYIPEDNIFSRINKKRTDLLLLTAKESNYNCVRVWGGGYFPDDYFYDLCDEKGLLIWQDNLFSCASYDLSDEFKENIEAEIRQNVRRLRSHACIGMWCGNNELETQYEGNAWPKNRKQFYDYIRIFEYIIPEIIKEEDPGAFYFPSSPSSGGNFLNSNAENVGDTHYWGVWHGNEPFTAFRKHHYRFLSEFGFQALPPVQTIERFTEPEDRNIFSRVMEMHQRNTSSNGKIMSYISQTYLYPKDFEALIYCSELLQATAIRYGVEHFRRFRGTCMGTVVWQLNDIWPVASWASVDYYGNWKALQYAEKKMFAPILLSCEEHGEIDQKPYPNTLPKPVDISADLHVANETGNEVNGLVKWSLRRPDSSVIKEGEFSVNVKPYSGSWLPHLDFNGEDPLTAHLYYELIIDGKKISDGTALFCAPKHYKFLDPELSVSVDGDEVSVTARNFAQAVSIDTPRGVLRLSDNFFDMEVGTRKVKILPSRDFTVAGDELNQPAPDGGEAVEDARSGKINVRSVYDIAN